MLRDLSALTSPSIITAAFAAAGGRRDKMHELIPDLVLALQANDDTGGLIGNFDNVGV